MQLALIRDTFNDDCTLGVLTVDGNQKFQTLEDKVREIEGEPVAQWKIYGLTAIPRGSYEVIVNYSQHFGKYLPELLNVPGYTGIRIHAGNTGADTDGCILVGTGRSGHAIINSQIAVAELLPLITAAAGRGEVTTIDIS